MLRGYSKPIMAEIIYYPNSDRVKQIIKRSFKDTRDFFDNKYEGFNRVIRYFMKPTKAGRDGLYKIAEYDSVPFIAGYIDSSFRIDKHLDQQLVNPKEIAQYPGDLNTFGGLKFDLRYDDESVESKELRYFDLDCDGILNGDNCPLELYKKSHKLFLYWHIFNIICNGDKEIFKYFMVLKSYSIRLHMKPGVCVVLISAPGVGKTCVFGSNTNGKGVYPVIFEGFCYSISDLDQLTAHFNEECRNKLFVVCEDATPNYQRKNNQTLKTIISDGELNFTPKGVDTSTNVKDHRAFQMHSQRADCVVVEEGCRRYFIVKASDRFTLKAIAEGRCTPEFQKAYNLCLLGCQDNEALAYEVYKDHMTWKIDINMGYPPTTELKRQQMLENTCPVLRFIQDIHVSFFKLRDSRCYPWVNEYDEYQGVQYDHENYKTYSKQLLSNALFKEFNRMVEESSTAGDYTSRHRTNGGVANLIDFGRKLSEVSKKFPDLITKEVKGSRMVYYQIKFDLESAKIAQQVDWDGYKQ